MTPRRHGENDMDGWGCDAGFKCVNVLDELTIVDKNITHDNGIKNSVLLKFYFWLIST
jgi:hypothetical protein